MNWDGTTQHCVSFEVMRALGVKAVLTFDPHFREQGFAVSP